ncbi:Os04g0632000 [Oryza sativa Japonica Group]|uniref:Os04g0632000 protein n=3 Tax=Oryza TaxID=4527 RepID=Q0J9T6_ORYSJ|nr:hypothetical protein EE612_025744 [Oryza sativa]BAF15901.1 Os04g0632000 [Oryza sativa Japonica Group]BAS91178.1 Os04g0632000 [Oryza sativa Japonica Group]|eukprot:NP_001053987.1 Os04g0632000 [Oryza sativa Japonica Group]
MASVANEGVVIGLSRLATQTYVRSDSEMLWYHMPRKKLWLEAVGEKKPSAKTLPLEMSTSPGEISRFACVSWSSPLQEEMRNSKEMKTGRQAIIW